MTRDPIRRAIEFDLDLWTEVAEENDIIDVMLLGILLIRSSGNCEIAVETVI